MPITIIKDPNEEPDKLEPQPEREIVVQAEVVIEREENEQIEFVTGDWYWVKFEGEKEEDLVCIVSVGSNYVKVKGPFCNAVRIHIDEFPKISRPAPEYKEYINKQIVDCRQKIQGLLEEAKELTRRLGVTPQTLLTAEERNASESRSLAVVSEAQDTEAYKKELVKLKDKTLPDIFNKVRRQNEQLAAWMGSEVIALNSQIDMMRGAEDQINGKIFNVSIYAGLQEKVIRFAEGEPAQFHEKLHVYQRKLYMDEECLLNYEHGGMDFESIHAFNSWIAKPENRDVILPNPRSLVVMQVRRNRKHRDSFGCPATAFMNAEFAKADEEKYIYIRNGENLYCIATDLDFPDKVFPDNDILNLTEPMYAEIGHKIKLVPERTYKESWKEYVKNKAEWKKNEDKRVQWNRDQGLENPESKWTGVGDPHAKTGTPDTPKNPYKYRYCPEFEYRGYSKFDDDNVYFDDIKEHIQKEAEKYNRIALIIQGLLDRSEILHPHPPICIWKSEDFNACIKLVYDHDCTLYDGDPPDFKDYFAKNNATIKKGSLVVGQELYWLQKEMEKEEQRRRRRGEDTRYMVLMGKPYGNPGPGKFCRIKHWKPRSKKAVFTWERERTAWGHWRKYHAKDTITCRIEVPREAMFNIDAYKPGDYKKFANDPRTRAQYLEWAPVMLLAEEYHAGNYDVEIDAWKKEREEGFEPDGKGRRVRVTVYKDRKVTETRDGQHGEESVLTEFGDFDGPEYVEPDDITDDE